MKRDPKPNARRHGGNRFTFEQRWQRELAVHYAGQLQSDRDEPNCTWPNE
jgi:hypothetical protein